MREEKYVLLLSLIRHHEIHRTGTMDVVEEALYYFRANVFFRNFEMKGAADRVLVYLTLLC